MERYPNVIYFQITYEEINNSPAYRMQNFIFFKLYEFGYRDLQGKCHYEQNFETHDITVKYYPTRKDVLFKVFERKF